MANANTIKELTRLRAVTKARPEDVNDWKLRMAAMTEGLSDLSDEAIEAGCRAWAQQKVWFPSLAELREFCRDYGPRIPESHRLYHRPPPGLPDYRSLSKRERRAQDAKWKTLVETLRESQKREEKSCA